MQTYKKHTAIPSPGEAAQQQNAPFSMGGGALTDGASRLDLPDAMRAKMENAFGADLSGVKFYQSEKVAEGGANAVTMGNAVAFAPGKFDMSSHSGQALLGHELSHVVSQQRGEVRGQGLLNDYALEARADREGALAAAGQQVYSGPVTPLSASSASTMAGPMQCSKPDKDEKARYKAAMASRPKYSNSVEVDHIPTKLRETVKNPDNTHEVVESKKSYAERHLPRSLRNTDRAKLSNKMENVRAPLGQFFRKHGYRKGVDIRGWLETEDMNQDAELLKAQGLYGFSELNQRQQELEDEEGFIY